MVELSEKLDCGGTLKVTLTDWEILYYIEGPDRRYKGTFFRIESTQMYNYIVALDKNFSEYERLFEVFSSEGGFSKYLDLGMSINVNKDMPSINGLRLSSHNQPISTRFQLEKLIDTYNSARSKAKKMQVLLREM